MKIAHISSEWLKKQIKSTISSHLSPSYHIFFFGSRVRGDSGERSDIDVGVEGPHALSPEKKLVVEEKLNEIPTLYKIDFVDFNTVSPKFKREALKYIETI